MLRQLTWTLGVGVVVDKKLVVGEGLDDGYNAIVTDFVNDLAAVIDLIVEVVEVAIDTIDGAAAVDMEAVDSQFFVDNLGSWRAGGGIRQKSRVPWSRSLRPALRPDTRGWPLEKVQRPLGAARCAYGWTLDQVPTDPGRMSTARAVESALPPVSGCPEPMLRPGEQGQGGLPPCTCCRPALGAVAGLPRWVWWVALAPGGAERERQKLI
ncbi:hypothetical protein NDU88_005602 [Pleurodeles waltl]|uniref:Uncharacterized protein n=1 Tax=Pleurodeles waltl TaxID=8319 RepID=A0AAV7LQ05_PLEWA|nr:hypothetical protein NDU88_005602 [Pleurodeles waltl]